MSGKMKEAVMMYTSGADDPNGRWITPEPDGDAAAKLAEIIGTDVPAELLELYALCNGIGYTNDFGVSEVAWFVPGIDELPTIISEGRDWFSGTHPGLASRFFPILDEGGDYTGYLRNPDGSWEKSVFAFTHDCYEFEVGQDEEDFMTDLRVNLTNYLREISEYKDQDT